MAVAHASDFSSRRIMAMGHYLLGRPWGVGVRKFKK